MKETLDTNSKFKNTAPLKLIDTGRSSFTSITYQIYKAYQISLKSKMAISATVLQ